MTARRYFQGSFLLPLLVPVPAVLLLGHTLEFRALAMMVYYSTIIGALPYLLFLIGLFFWTRGRDSRLIQRITLVAPFLFVAFFLLCVLVVIPIQYMKLGEVRIEADGVAGFCIAFLIIGYAYVLVVNVGYFILRAVGLFSTQPAA
jgi:hypothetical protein